jgi:hypothetical protein
MLRHAPSGPTEVAIAAFRTRVPTLAPLVRSWTFAPRTYSFDLLSQGLGDRPRQQRSTVRRSLARPPRPKRHGTPAS